ncbi:hypothetical protein EFW57_03855 [Bacillus velezensis]|nr:hypothetical protein B4140_3103 [Bacillus amyloliquefaciens]RUR95912.1 hypothetical protein EFW57_03855 [Bacillus velezensis]
MKCLRFIKEFHHYFFEFSPPISNEAEDWSFPDDIKKSRGIRGIFLC